MARYTQGELIITVRKSICRPTKKEPTEDLRIDAMPDELALAIMQHVKLGKSTPVDDFGNWEFKIYVPNKLEHSSCLSDSDDCAQSIDS